MRAAICSHAIMPNATTSSPACARANTHGERASERENKGVYVQRHTHREQPVDEMEGMLGDVLGADGLQAVGASGLAGGERQVEAQRDHLQREHAQGEALSSTVPSGRGSGELHILCGAAERDELAEERREQAVQEKINDGELAAARGAAQRQPVHERGDVPEHAANEEAAEVADARSLERAVAAQAEDEQKHDQV